MSGAASKARVLHHRPANSLPLALRQHRDIFNDSRSGAALGQIIQNQQRVSARDCSIRQRHEYTVVGISAEAREMLAGLFHRKGLAAIDSGARVSVKDVRQIAFDGLADFDFAHALIISVLL